MQNIVRPPGSQSIPGNLPILANADASLYRSTKVHALSAVPVVEPQTPACLSGGPYLPTPSLCSEDVPATCDASLLDSRAQPLISLPVPHRNATYLPSRPYSEACFPSSGVEHHWSSSQCHSSSKSPNRQCKAPPAVLTVLFEHASRPVVQSTTGRHHSAPASSSKSPNR